jgi:hypothetical protein
VAKFNLGCLYLVFLLEDLLRDLMLVGDTGRTDDDALYFGKDSFLFESVLIRFE